jgi:RNA polymerase sigma-54 factor
MALTPRLEQRQSQSLVMTPQLQQAIKLLQLSNLDLADFVADELEKNPLLEREDTVVESVSADLDERSTEQSDAPADADADFGRLDLDADAGVGAADRAIDADIDNSGAAEAFEDPGDPFAYADAAPGGGRFESADAALEERVAGAVSLRDHLMNQLTMAVPDAADRLIGQYLIDGLDDAGYLIDPVDETAAQLGVETARVEAVLAAVRGFDPVGVFARDLADCLAMQLEDRNAFDPAMQALVANLELVARREYSKLETLCGVDREDIVDMVDEIRNLDPKPAQAFAGEAAPPVVPDVLLSARADGAWSLDLNPESLPRVLVNRRYHADIAGRITDKDGRRYLSEQLQSANWLVRALHQRATTIMKVSEEIVRRQDGFFRHGVDHLKPMILRDVAEAVEMHESTVSRVTANKYIASPRGLFELKYFFTGAIQSAAGGDAHSSESVRQRLKALIDAEDAKAILSDDKLVKVLRAEGIDIARRTVAKYRESLGIPSSVERRRQKAAPK